MADYQDLQTIANDAAFRGRCIYALVVQATYEMANTNPLSPQLQAFCTQAIDGQVQPYQVALVVLSAGAVAAAATVASLPGCTDVSDAQILSAIATYFNAMAGVATYPED